MTSLITHFTFKVQRNLLFSKNFVKLWLVIWGLFKGSFNDSFYNSLKEAYMAQIYDGPVSIIKNTVNKITVKADSEGKYSQENVSELYADMKKHNKAIAGSILAPFTPEPQGKNLQPVLLSGRGNTPYLSLLPEQDEKSKNARKRVVKLG
jgi:hypothetical protein